MSENSGSASLCPNLIFDVPITIGHPNNEGEHDRVSDDVEPSEVLDSGLEPATELALGSCGINHAKDSDSP
jgi:hypothetical protein